MWGTEIDVFRSVDARLVITPLPLRAVISGGVRRDVSSGDVIFFDGTESYDPDVKRDMAQTTLQ